MSMNLPFEPQEPADVPVRDVLMCGGVVVMSVIVEGHPGIMLRFSRADGGGFLPPICIACDDPDDLRRLPGLFKQAVDHAIAVTT